MFQFKTTRPDRSPMSRSPMSRRTKVAAATMALAFSLSVASEGHAAQFFLQQASMNTARTGRITGPGMNANTYMAPVTFKTYLGTGATAQTGATSGAFDMVGFCVDIFHGISLGNINLKYDDKYDLTTNSKYLTANPFVGATPLTNAQRLQVGRLVNYGTLIAHSGAMNNDKLNRLSALQGAIWKTINPTYNVAATNGNAGFNAAVTNYYNTYRGANYATNLTGYGTVHSGITFISETGKYGKNSAHQSFAIAGVPEPGTWLVMILGFGLTGAMLRRSRDRLALATVSASI